MSTQQITPISKSAEVIHLEILRQKRDRKRRAADATEINAKNRNLSLEWSK